jgi:hypothetical protein
MQKWKMEAIFEGVFLSVISFSLLFEHFKLFWIKKSDHHCR